MPEVKKPLSISDWISGSGDSRLLVLDPVAEIKLSDLSIEGDSISILIGPEGGFTHEELEKVRANGALAVSLGPRVLRTETAGPAAIAVLKAKTGDI